MNRPDRMNSFGGHMGGAPQEAFVDFRDDPDARVAILTGAGRGSCGGADLHGRPSRVRRRVSGGTARRGSGAAGQRGAGPEASRCSRNSFERSAEWGVLEVVTPWSYARRTERIL